MLKNIVKLKYKVGVYPVAKDSWIDIGTLDNYKNLINNCFKFMELDIINKSNANIAKTIDKKIF